jgi:mRNA interferase MazF
VAPVPHHLRGQVFEVDIEGIGRKLWLVVSNNPRNRNLGDVLVARLTTTRKEPRPSIVELERRDSPFTGRVICDDIGPLFKDELGRARGALSRQTMHRVDRGLVAALGIDPGSLVDAPA